mmetsp:Transcript_31251/g.50359  ORF Transcript_31251/g.50359 Transcript_31251/m.50359 type:complete len:212 (+) Transcript_31251:177-812(+)
MTSPSSSPSSSGTAVDMTMLMSSYFFSLVLFSESSICIIVALLGDCVVSITPSPPSSTKAAPITAPPPRVSGTLPVDACCSDASAPSLFSSFFSSKTGELGIGTLAKFTPPPVSLLLFSFGSGVGTGPSPSKAPKAALSPPAGRSMLLGDISKESSISTEEYASKPPMDPSPMLPSSISRALSIIFTSVFNFSPSEDLRSCELFTERFSMF